MPTITIPRPHPGQRQIRQNARRYNVVAWGRRAGKTEEAKALCVDPAVLRYPVAYYAPTYKDMLEVWRSMVMVLEPVTLRVSTADRRIENVAGGVLEFWSPGSGNAGRGRKYKRVIFDECAFIPGLLDMWNSVVRPTLIDYQGDAWFFSTPKGRGGFWQLWQKGQDATQEEWVSWQMSSTVNPHVSADEIAAMASALPELVYRQEILAEFIDDTTGVFRRVMDAATATERDGAIGGHEYTFGVDWGRSNDFTAVAVLDTTTSELVALDRFNQIDYSLQLARLTALYERFRPRAIVAEANSMGQPLIEQLREQGLPVIPFTTTAASKQVAVDALALAFERGALRIIPDPVLIAELQAYEAERLPSGMLRYGAPAGMHDDTAMALMLAWYNPTPATAGVTSYVQRSFSTAQRPRR